MSALRSALRSALAALVTLALPGPAHAQEPKLRLGIYAPSVEFGSATARLSYVQALGKAIEQSTGLEVEAQSYASLATLRKEAVDVAIIDGPCYATNLGWRLLANASIGGATTRPWALYASVPDMQSLRGKKLSYITTGCNDAGFIDNAMLDSEVDPTFFAARIGKPDLAAAVAEVAATKTAQAVFAPAGAAKGLTKLFDTGTVPNPALVDVSGKLPAGTAEKIAAAATGFGGSGPISGWTRPSRDVYTSLAGRLGKVVKNGVLASPEPVRIDARDVLIDPPTIREPALVGLRHHFVRAPGERLE
ncbi:MAG TPA: hypothetical protein VNO30_24865 [Kofleriaceae bacterium]|nr:hypothetical protein [Kofleriaceae bacterium]